MVVLSLTFVFREKNGVTRYDFLDCMIELRNKGRRGSQGDEISGKSSKNDRNFGKLHYTRWVTLRKYMKSN
jgi:hypothetical protein